MVDLKRDLFIFCFILYTPYTTTMNTLVLSLSLVSVGILFSIALTMYSWAVASGNLFLERANTAAGTDSASLKTTKLQIYDGHIQKVRDTLNQWLTLAMITALVTVVVLSFIRSATVPVRGD